MDFKIRELNDDEYLNLKGIDMSLEVKPKMCDYKQRFKVPENEVIYVACDENDIIWGEKLSSIVEYVAKSVLGPIESGRSQKESYDNYDKFCKALQNKFVSYEPYEESTIRKIVNWDKSAAIEQMKSFVPYYMKNRLIEESAGELVVDMSAKFRVSEFSVIIYLFRSGENLDIVPFFMRVYAINEEKRFLFWTWKVTNLWMKYQQKKFTLNKLDILKIIEKRRLLKSSHSTSK